MSCGFGVVLTACEGSDGYGYRFSKVNSRWIGKMEGGDLIWIKRWIFKMGLTWQLIV